MDFNVKSSVTKGQKQSRKMAIVSVRRRDITVGVPENDERMSGMTTSDGEAAKAA